MTAEQAKQALREGKRVRAVKWWRYEYIYEKPSQIFFNHITSIDEIDEAIFEDYKDDEWEIVE